MVLKTKDKKPDGIDPLIDALPEIHETTESIKKIIKGWGINQVIDPKDDEQIKTWLRNAETDNSRKIARCALRCIYDNWVISS